jgi:hypothetical protein
MSSKVLSAVARAKTALGDLVLTATLTKITGAYDPALLKTVDTPKSYSVDGFIGDWKENRILDQSVRNDLDVRMDDVQFYMFPADVEPTQNDTMTVLGTKYTIVNVQPYMAGSVPAVSMIHLRR